MHAKADAQSHVTPASRSSAKHSGLTLPKDLFCNKVSRQKKAHTPREDDSLVSIQNLECKQDDNNHHNHVGQARETIGEDVNCYDTFSANEFIQEFSALQKSFSHFALIKCKISTKELLNVDKNHNDD